MDSNFLLAHFNGNEHPVVVIVLLLEAVVHFFWTYRTLVLPVTAAIVAALGLGFTLLVTRRPKRRPARVPVPTLPWDQILGESGPKTFA
jgi:hypothetical protein